MDPNDELPEDNETQVFNPDAGAKPEQEEDAGPAYRMYADSKIAIGRGIGDYWRRHKDAALRTYDTVNAAWDEAFKYYGYHQMSELDTSNGGRYRRGDGSENVILSNINTLLPAVYSQNPTFECSTVDGTDEPMCKALKPLLNSLFRRKDKLDAKPKIKKQVAATMLTNFGVTKIDWVKKPDSREQARESLIEISEKMATVKTGDEAEKLYGQLSALEQMIVTLEPAGPNMTNVHPKRLIIDPNAEKPDGTDAMWMMEKVYIQTSRLIAQFTKPDPESDEGEDDPEVMRQRVLVYKPTHKATFKEGVGDRDDGIGMVMEAINSYDGEITGVDQEREAYLKMYHTECFLVWDKATRRVMLFHCDDWKWPLWVWDDPLNISRFYPYFIMSFLTSMGGAVTAGEVAYYLDQQDEVNQINKQVARIRRGIFSFFYYNSDTIDQQQAEKFINALRGESRDTNQIHLLGVKAGEQGSIEKLIQAFVPPSIQFKEFFAKEPILATIQRMTNVNDALRGEQFRTNTTEDAVQTYQESMRISIGSKVDVIEDSMSDMGLALAELCVMNMSPEEVEGYIGKEAAKGWQPMSIEDFRANYDVQIVAGSTEKPNSVFKKKEAIQVAQSLGQFAQGAPATAMRITLRVIQNAFTDVTVHPEDWAMLDKEMQATMNKGNNAPPGAPAASGGGGGDMVQEAIAKLSQEDKAQVMQMAQSGTPPDQIASFVKSKLGMNGAAPAQENPNGGTTIQ